TGPAGARTAQRAFTIPSLPHAVSSIGRLPISSAAVQTSRVPVLVRRRRCPSPPVPQPDDAGERTQLALDVGPARLVDDLGPAGPLAGVEASRPGVGGGGGARRAKPPAGDDALTGGVEADRGIGVHGRVPRPRRPRPRPPAPLDPSRQGVEVTPD